MLTAYLEHSMAAHLSIRAVRFWHDAHVFCPTCSRNPRAYAQAVFPASWKVLLDWLWPRGRMSGTPLSLLEFGAGATHRGDGSPRLT